jgi:hypothetical protein
MIATDTRLKEDSMATYAIARLDEIDALPDGRYRYRPVRHHFGITSFGVTAWVGAAAGDPIINEYDEDSEPTEELFVVVSGRAIFELEGEEVEATPGTLSSPGRAHGERPSRPSRQPRSSSSTARRGRRTTRPAGSCGRHSGRSTTRESTPSSGRGSKTSSPPIRSIRCSSTTWPAARA